MVVTVDVLMPSTSQYGVLHHFTQKLYEAFVRLGAKCRLLSGDERIFATLSSPPDFTIGFNGAIKMEDGSFFCDHIKVPHVACLVDPPYRFLDLTKSAYMIIACDDQIGCSLLQKHHFDSSVFMPHAVEPELGPNLKTERPYDIAFLGTSSDAKTRRSLWKRQFGPEVAKLMEEAVKVALEDDKISFISILEKHLDPAHYQGVYEAVEMAVKGADRLRLVTGFSGCQVHIFGGDIDPKGWKEFKKWRPDIVLHPAVSYDQALEVMKQSKVVLNSSIKNKLGAHERIFTAAACGAVVVTNDNPFIRQYFKEGKEILLYDASNSQDVHLQVQALLEDEPKRRKMAAAGRKRVMQAHTWDHRVQHLLRDITPLLKKINEQKT